METTRSVSDMLVAGRFRVDSPIAAGSMGEVWLAEDVHLGARVAVKFLREQFLADPWAVQRFFSEARIAAKLETRHVVRVLDFGTTDCGRPFVVMEYLDGETLAARLHRLGVLPPAVALRLLAPIARTLARAHALGVVHRDLKPENVFLALEEDGASTPKVIDFGVAKILAAPSLASCRSLQATLAQPPPSAPGAASGRYLAGTPTQIELHETDDRVLGTPPYMAPEQCQSIPDATPASDQWAFGVVMYECLTGQLPFPRLKHSELYRVLQFGRFTPAARVNPALPEAFDRWLRTVLAVDPAHRFPNLVACVDALAQALGEPERARETHRPSRRGGRAVMTATGLAFAATVLVAAVRSSSPALPPLARGGAPAPPPPQVLAVEKALPPACPVAAPAPVVEARKAEATLATHLDPVAVPPPVRASRALSTSHASASYRRDPY